MDRDYETVLAFDLQHTFSVYQKLETSLERAIETRHTGDFAANRVSIMKFIPMLRVARANFYKVNGQMFAYRAEKDMMRNGVRSLLIKGN